MHSAAGALRGSRAHPPLCRGLSAGLQCSEQEGASSLSGEKPQGGEGTGNCLLCTRRAEAGVKRLAQGHLPKATCRSHGGTCLLSSLLALTKTIPGPTSTAPASGCWPGPGRSVGAAGQPTGQRGRSPGVGHAPPPRLWFPLLQVGRVSGRRKRPVDSVPFVGKAEAPHLRR